MSAKAVDSSRAAEDARWAASGVEFAEAMRKARRRHDIMERVAWALLAVLVAEVVIMIGGLAAIICKVYGFI